MNKLKSWLIPEIQEHLYNYEDQEIYACDLAYTIFEGENIDGSYTYSTYEAKEWIKKYWDDIGEVVEEIKFQLGSDCIPNPFDEPEKFQVVIVLEAASYVFGKCDFLEKNWNNEIKLTKRNIKKIINQIENNHYEFYE